MTTSTVPANTTTAARSVAEEHLVSGSMTLSLGASTAQEAATAAGSSEVLASLKSSIAGTFGVAQDEIDLVVGVVAPFTDGAARRLQGVSLQVDYTIVAADAFAADALVRHINAVAPEDIFAELSDDFVAPTAVKSAIIEPAVSETRHQWYERQVARGCSYSEEACRNAATDLGLDLGVSGTFAGVWDWVGCYAYDTSSGSSFAGVAFYGLLADGSEVANEAQLSAPSWPRYRLPNTHECGSSASDTATTLTTGEPSHVELVPDEADVVVSVTFVAAITAAFCVFCIGCAVGAWLIGVRSGKGRRVEPAGPARLGGAYSMTSSTTSSKRRDGEEEGSQHGEQQSFGAVPSVGSAGFSAVVVAGNLAKDVPAVSAAASPVQPGTPPEPDEDSGEQPQIGNVQSVQSFALGPSCSGNLADPAVMDAFAAINAGVNHDLSSLEGHAGAGVRFAPETPADCEEEDGGSDDQPEIGAEKSWKLVSCSHHGSYRAQAPDDDDDDEDPESALLALE